MHRLRRHPLRAAGLAVAVLLLAAGCSPKDKSKVLVAEVEGRPISLAYFERKMNTMEAQYLPPDLNTQASREKLLEIMIDKEVMALKAEELGMAADGDADKQARAIASLRAVSRMRDSAVEPAKSPSEDDIYDYYENYARKLSVSYMLFDHEETAREAKALVEGGEEWTTVAERFEAGDPGPTNNWKLDMKYGTVADDLEKVVFDLPVGEISDPIDSIYGWFLVRVDAQTNERVPPLDTIREKIVASVVKQNSQLLIKDFVEKVFDEYGFSIDEEVLQTLFDALPEDVALSPPPDPSELQPLDLRPIDLDRVLMKYHDQVWTLRRYSDFYDQSSAFGRPRRERRLGNLRRSLKEIAIRDLMPVVALDRGFEDDPVVQDEKKLRREQAMVTKLHAEVIKGTVEVTPEEVQQYWAEHAEEFVKNEQREVLAVVAPSETEALAAQLAAQNGMDWSEVVAKYCIAGDLKNAQGKLGTLAEPDASFSAYAQHAFQAGGEGTITYPAKIAEGQWLVLKILKVVPREEPTFEQAQVLVGKKLEAIKEEQKFQEKLSEWKAAYDIKRYPKQLMKAVYDPQEKVTPSIPIEVGTGR